MSNPNKTSREGRKKEEQPKCRNKQCTYYNEKHAQNCSGQLADGDPAINECGCYSLARELEPVK
jgi:hypothetical protein